MFSKFLISVAALLAGASAVELDPTDQSSIKAAAASVAKGVLSYYANAEASSPSDVGTYPFPPYYWWESGAAWGALVDYYAYTKDDTYLNETLDALAAQVGPAYDYVMPEQVFNEANDDQAFWLFSVLSALEGNLPALPCPSGTSGPDCPTSYTNLAANAFNDYVNRWNLDSDYCDGGLRWQYNSNMSGWTYKNSVSNGGFFQISARLAKATGNTTYSDWASKIYNWTESVKFISSTGQVFDGAGIDNNCSAVDQSEWTYNSAIYMYGAAVMYNVADGAEPWGSRIQSLVDSANATFFNSQQNATGVMSEIECEASNTCDTDQFSFKGYMSRFMAKSVSLAPMIRETVTGLLTNSSIGAAQSCAGGADGNACGVKWYVDGFDGTTGLGQQMSGLETIQSLMLLTS